MVSAVNGEIKEEFHGKAEDGTKSTGHSPNPNSTPVREQQISILRRSTFSKLGSPTRRFWQYADGRDLISQSVSSSTDSHHIRERLKGVFLHKINGKSLWHMCQEWFRNPMNLALFVWIVCVAVSGAILFLVMTGMLNKALPNKSERNTWFEVNNQILNALFTLMCLYQHPQRFYHLAMLIRWQPDDISKLRKIYCKNGTYKPHEWAHMVFVVILLHINCFAQYALCGLNVGYRRAQRPPIGVAVCISVAIAAPAIAGVYMIVSPLGKEYDFDGDEESLGVPVSIVERKRRDQIGIRTHGKSFSLVVEEGHSINVTNPNWKGGILDFWEDITLAYLSLFCAYCVFGWNMERLGFGNMYVHIITFLLFCSAPFWIFNLAAINIDNEMVRQALGVSGVLLCVFGLLYGGYWRIRMRKRFNLPEYKFCFGKPSASDCTLWLCCCWCSLAQEVRTANAYDIVDNKFCQKPDVVESVEMEVSQLDSAGPIQGFSGPSSPLFAGCSPSSAMSPETQLPSPKTDVDGLSMKPPSPVFINKWSS